MSTARHREMSALQGWTGSSFYYIANPQTQLRSAESGETRVCDDVIGNRDGVNPLSLAIKTAWRPSLDGTLYSGATKVRELINYPIDLNPMNLVPDPRTKFPVPDELDRSAWAWEILGATNISKAHVSVPTFIGELKDLPSLVHGWGRSLLQSIAKGHLSWRWAIKPMVSDIRKLLMFQQAVRRRNLELSLLRVQRYQKRKVQLDSSALTEGPTTVTINSSNAVISSQRTTQYSSRVWGSVKWVLDDSVVLPPENDKLWQQAWNLTFGITTHGALEALWELTPWSWLLDWFFGFGTVLAATNNTIKATWAQTCVMRTTQSRVIWSVTPGTWQSWCRINGTPWATYVRKERWPATPLLPFIPSLRPLVSPKAWSILASLYVLRRGVGTPRS